MSESFTPAPAQVPVKTKQDVLTELADQSAPVVWLSRQNFVPVLPVRYALGLDQSEPPRVQEPFRVVDSDGKAMPVKGKTRYTLRRLRDGYLHVYREKDQAWTSYLVSSQGGPLKRAYTDPRYEDPKNAPDLGPIDVANDPRTDKQPTPIKATNSGMLLIPDDSPVWMAFSDALWTPQVRANFGDKALRDKHMRYFDPRAWKSDSTSGDHMVALDDAHLHVADFFGEMRSKKWVNTLSRGAFWFSDDPFLRAPMSALQLMKVTKEIKTVIPSTIMDRGVTIALDDPSGIAMDLATLMMRRYDEFMDKPDPVFKDHPLRRRTGVASAIALIEQEARNEGKHNAMSSQKENRKVGKQVAREVEDHARQAGYSKEQAASYRSSIEAAHADPIIGMKVNQAEKDYWKRYSDCYNPGAITQWQKDVKPAVEAFNTQTLQPLASMYETWMKSQRMQDYCWTHFDTNDGESGLVYTLMMGRCLAGVQDKGACDALIQEWLDGGPEDRNKYVLRGFVLNQDKLAKAIVDANKGGAELPLDGWATLLAIFEKELARLEDGHQDVLVRFMSQILGATIKVMDRSRMKMLATIQGAIMGRPVTDVTLKGSQEAFLRALLETSLSGATGKSGERVRQLVESEADLLKVKGEPLDKELTISMLVVVDPDGMVGMPSGLSRVEQVKWVRANIKTPTQFKALPVWKNALQRTGSFVKSKSGPLLKAASGALLFFNMKQLSKQLKGSMTHKIVDSQWRYYASVGAFAGAIMGGIADVLNMTPRLLKMGRGLSVVRVVRGFNLVGEILGGLAGLVVAAMDGRMAVIEASRGHYGLMGLYLASTAAGIASSVLYFVGFIYTLKAGAALAAGMTTLAAELAVTAATIFGWGMLFALVGLAIGLIVAENTNDPIQDWLLRCIFRRQVKKGEKDIDYYPNMYLERYNLEKAIGG